MQSAKDDSFAMANRDHSFLPKQKAKQEKESSTSASHCAGLIEKSICPLLGMENKNKPLGVLFVMMLNGRDSFFTQECQCLSEVLTHETTNTSGRERVVSDTSL